MHRQDMKTPQQQLQVMEHRGQAHPPTKAVVASGWGVTADGPGSLYQVTKMCWN